MRAWNVRPSGLDRASGFSFGITRSPKVPFTDDSSFHAERRDVAAVPDWQCRRADIADADRFRALPQLFHPRTRPSRRTRFMAPGISLPFSAPERFIARKPRHVAEILASPGMTDITHSRNGNVGAPTSSTAPRILIHHSRGAFSLQGLTSTPYAESKNSRVASLCSAWCSIQFKLASRNSLTARRPASASSNRSRR